MARYATSFAFLQSQLLLDFLRIWVVPLAHILWLDTYRFQNELTNLKHGTVLAFLDDALLELEHLGGRNFGGLLWISDH